MDNDDGDPRRSGQCATRDPPTGAQRGPELGVRHPRAPHCPPAIHPTPLIWGRGPGCSSPRAGRQGYIILPGCASSVGEISAEHPTLLSYAEDLCGLHFRPDLPLRPLSEALASEWVGGDSMLDPAREYFHWPEGHVYVTDRGNQGETLPVATRVRQCQGLLAVWATEDVEEGAADMLGLVPCSHQSNVPPPRGKPHGHCWYLGCILPRAPAMILRGRCDGGAAGPRDAAGPSASDEAGRPAPRIGGDSPRRRRPERQAAELQLHQPHCSALGRQPRHPGALARHDCRKES